MESPPDSFSTTDSNATSTNAQDSLSSQHRPPPSLDNPTNNSQEPNFNYQEADSNNRGPNFKYQESNCVNHESNSKYRNATSNNCRDPNSNYRNPTSNYQDATSNYDDPASNYQEPSSKYWDPTSTFDNPNRSEHPTNPSPTANQKPSPHHQRDLPTATATSGDLHSPPAAYSDPPQGYSPGRTPEAPGYSDSAPCFGLTPDSLVFIGSPESTSYSATGSLRNAESPSLHEKSLHDEKCKNTRSLSVRFGPVDRCNMDKVRFSEDGNESEDDYSASVSAIILRRASSKRRSRSSFSPEEFSNTSRRRSSVFTTSSGDTGVSMEEIEAGGVGGGGGTDEQVVENIRLHKEVLSNVKQQPWSMRRKLKLVQQAKSYIKRHEGELQERLAQSRSTKDFLARFNILLVKEWQHSKRELANVMNLLIPWELRIKEIESHFGSAVASYFTFLRWLFFVNFILALGLILFVTIPELLSNPTDCREMKKPLPEEEKESRKLYTLFEFEGILKYSPIFYGYYNNQDNSRYKTPLAFFIVTLLLYIYSFVAILKRMAANSKMSKLADKDDECVFTWKLFSGWDYMIGNAETAQNRTSSIILGFKEALVEEAEKQRDHLSWKIICIRIIVNILVVFLLGISAYTIIEVVSRSQDPNRPQTVWHKNEAVVVIWIIGVTFPRLLEKLGNLEQLHPRKHLRMLLARIMVLQVVNLYTFFLEHLSETGDTIAELQRLKPKGNGSSSTTSSPSYTPMPNVRDCLRKLVRCSLVTHLLTNNFSNVTYLPSSTAGTILPGTLPGKFNVTNTSHHLFVNTSSGDLSGLNGTFSTAILHSTLSSVPYNSTVISLTINSTYNSVTVNSTLTSVTLNYTLNSATTYPNITSANINVNQSQSKGIQTTYFGLNNTEFNGTIEDDVTPTGFSTVFSTNPTTFDNGNTTENSTRNVSSTQALPDTESHIPIDPGTTPSFDQSNTLSNGTRNNDTVVTGITEDPIESTTLDNVENPNEKSADGGNNTLRYDNTTLRAQTNDTDNESYEEYDDDLHKDEEDGDEGEEDEETLENGVNPNFPTPEYGERDELEERLKNYDYALEWSHENQSESNNTTRQSNEEAVKIPMRSKRNSRSPVSLVNEIKQPQDDLDLFEEFEINENNLTEHGEASTKRISTANTEEVNNGEHLLNDLPIQTDSLKIIPTADETLIENDFPNLDSDLSMEHSATTFSDYFLENFTDNSNDVIEGVNPSESITPPVLLDAETTEEVDVVDTTPFGTSPPPNDINGTTNISDVKNTTTVGTQTIDHVHQNNTESNVSVNTINTTISANESIVNVNKTIPTNTKFDGESTPTISLQNESLGTPPNNDVTTPTFNKENTTLPSFNESHVLSSSNNGCSANPTTCDHSIITLPSLNGSQSPSNDTGTNTPSSLNNTGTNFISSNDIGHSVPIPSHDSGHSIPTPLGDVDGDAMSGKMCVIIECESIAMEEHEMRGVSTLQTYIPNKPEPQTFCTEKLDKHIRRKLRTLCWETKIGQELVKLTVVDLVSTIGLTILSDAGRALFVRYMNPCWCWDLEKTFPKYADFNIAENILGLVYNQGYVWIGMFFAPGLPLINLIKLMVLMYLNSWAVLTSNVPHEVVFRASRSNNFYLALLLLQLFLAVLPVGYTIVAVEPSWHCGPFSGNDRMYDIFTRSIKKMLPDPVSHKVLDYIASPGTIIPLLILLILIIYYLGSLTSALKEANIDLKIQLRRERTEERRKMYQLVAKKKRTGVELLDSTLSKWREIIPDTPVEKTAADVRDGTPGKHTKEDFMMKFIHKTRPKASVDTSEKCEDDRDHLTSTEQTNAKQVDKKVYHKRKSSSSIWSSDNIPEIKISESNPSDVEESDEPESHPRKPFQTGSTDTVIEINEPRDKFQLDSPRKFKTRRSPNGRNGEQVENGEHAKRNDTNGGDKRHKKRKKVDSDGNEMEDSQRTPIKEGRPHDAGTVEDVKRYAHPADGRKHRLKKLSKENLDKLQVQIELEDEKHLPETRRKPTESSSDVDEVDERSGHRRRHKNVEMYRNLSREFISPKRKQLLKQLKYKNRRYQIYCDDVTVSRSLENDYDQLGAPRQDEKKSKSLNHLLEHR
ncbi:hypothetical protein M8J76_007152 [Diaphorina citri]|nr:hypothetical protein M8J76_007152 [Diaphorina citri]